MPLSEQEKLDAKIAMVSGRKCDCYDYLIAAFCGISAGLIDAFFVGAPGTGALGTVTDNIADTFVKKAAQSFWRLDQRSSKRKTCPESLTQCISYLEQAFPVPYDARYAKDLHVRGNSLSGMRPANHHLLALAHSPDPIGLIFSIIDQFTDMGSFIDQGCVIRVYPQKYSQSVPYLQGTDMASRLFCGFVNWIGHLISDLVGSSSTRQPMKTGRGAGVPIPFYELLLLCDFGNFDGQSFADIAVSTFEQGYDLRHGLAMAIPVLLNDVMVRLLWSIKRKAYHKYEWKDCIPSNKHSDLRWMLIVSNGALCLVDGADAFIKSKGNILDFVLHLNIIAWFKLVLMILKEILIRYGFAYEDLKLQFQRINVALDDYVMRLKSIDYAQYQKEIEEIHNINSILENDLADTVQIYSCFSAMGIEMQFHSFEEMDQNMQDPSFVLTI